MAQKLVQSRPDRQRVHQSKYERDWKGIHCKVFHERVRHVLRTIPNCESWNELGFCIECNSSPHIIHIAGCSISLGGLLLHSYESPYFINLDNLERKVLHLFVHEALTASTHAGSKAYICVSIEQRYWQKHPIGGKKLSPLIENLLDHYAINNFNSTASPHE